MPNYTPRSNRTEWHPTYLCDLSCTNCNRCCFLPPTTPDMTLGDARSFVQQAQELDWHPEIFIVGGEPTLYAQLFELLEIAQTLSPGKVLVWSNGYSDHAKKVLDKIQAEKAARIHEPTLKPHGNVMHYFNDMFLAACEFGNENREPCDCHSCGRNCGVSVDSGGYTICPMGGTIDGLFQLGVRTKRLADLFNVEFAEKQTRALCRLCGFRHGIDSRRIAKSQVLYGALMSPMWQEAVKRLAPQ